MKTETQFISVLLQEDCHRTVEKVMSKDSKVSYQDATNVWIFNKLAEYEFRLKKLETRADL